MTTPANGSSIEIETPRFSSRPETQSRDPQVQTMVASTKEERRASQRADLRLACEYVIHERLGGEAFEFHQGAGTVLNINSEGMSLLLGVQARILQVIQVYISHPRTGRTTSRVQVLWTRPAEDGKKHVVGCKFVSGPYSPSQNRTCAVTDFTSP